MSAGSTTGLPLPVVRRSGSRAFSGPVHRTVDGANSFWPGQQSTRSTSIPATDRSAMHPPCRRAEAGVVDDVQITAGHTLPSVRAGGRTPATGRRPPAPSRAAARRRASVTNAAVVAQLASVTGPMRVVHRAQQAALQHTAEREFLQDRPQWQETTAGTRGDGSRMWAPTVRPSTRQTGSAARTATRNAGRQPGPPARAVELPEGERRALIVARGAATSRSSHACGTRGRLGHGRRFPGRARDSSEAGATATGRAPARPGGTSRGRHESQHQARYRGLSAVALAVYAATALQFGPGSTSARPLHPPRKPRWCGCRTHAGIFKKAWVVTYGDGPAGQAERVCARFVRRWRDLVGTGAAVARRGQCAHRGQQITVNGMLSFTADNDKPSIFASPVTSGPMVVITWNSAYCPQDPAQPTTPAATSTRSRAPATSTRTARPDRPYHCVWVATTTDPALATWTVQQLTERRARRHQRGARRQRHRQRLRDGLAGRPRRPAARRSRGPWRRRQRLGGPGGTNIWYTHAPTLSGTTLRTNIAQLSDNNARERGSRAPRGRTCSSAARPRSWPTRRRPARAGAAGAASSTTRSRTRPTTPTTPAPSSAT